MNKRRSGRRVAAILLSEQVNDQQWDTFTMVASYYRARYYDPVTGRFLSEDPIQFSGGMNFFNYGSNSPTNASDPSGLWSTAAHDQMIWNALHPCGVSNADIWQIQQGSRWLDSNTQGSEWSYVHSMRDGNAGQGPAVAQQLRDQFIASQMHDAQEVLNAGGRDQAMFIFGVAMHPVMDMTSPAHTDPQGNPIPWCGFAPWSCSNLSQHGDSPWSIEDLNHLDSHPETQELENFLIRNWYQTLTGKPLNCCSRSGS